MTIRASATLLAAGAVAAGIAFVDVTPAQACGLDPYIGSVCVTAATFCPAPEYVEADGRLLQVNNYQALYSLLGKTYGGDGITNFALPDLRGRTPVGLNLGPFANPSGGTISVVTQGQKRGLENVTLAAAQLPAHTHPATFTASDGTGMSVDIPVSSNTTGNVNVPDADHSYLAGSPAGPLGAANWSGQMTKAASVKGVTVSGGSSGGTVTVNANTGGQSATNIPPQLGLRYCIAVQGTYPQRP